MSDQDEKFELNTFVLDVNIEALEKLVSTGKAIGLANGSQTPLGQAAGILEKLKAEANKFELAAREMGSLVREAGAITQTLADAIPNNTINPALRFSYSLSASQIPWPGFQQIAYDVTPEIGTRPPGSGDERASDEGKLV